MKADQDEVARVNRSGRLHPSQRGKVLDFNFWSAVAVFALGIFALTRLTIDTIYLAVPVVAVMALVVWFCAKRLSVVRHGTLITYTGRTHDADQHRPLPQQYPILLYTEMSQGRNPHYYVRFKGRQMPIYQDIHAKFQPDHKNTIYLTPDGKQIVNVIPS